MKGLVFVCVLTTIACAIETKARTPSELQTILQESHTSYRLLKVNRTTSNYVQEAKGRAFSSDHAGQNGRSNNRLDLHDLPATVHGEVYEDRDTTLTGVSKTGKLDSLRAVQILDLPSPMAHHVPPYMLDLYNKFASDRLVHPDANTVRSFLNQERGATASSSSASEKGRGLGIPARDTVDHNLMFNLTMPSQETILKTELRVYVLVSNGNTVNGGMSRVTVYDDQGALSHLLTSQVMYRYNDGWETIDLTDRLRLVAGRQNRPTSSFKKSDLVFESVRLKIKLQSLLGVGAYLDVDISHDVQFKPILLVYSDADASVSRESNLRIQEGLASRVHQDRASEPMGTSEQNHLSSILATRGKRNAPRHGLCKRRSMRIVFRDIGWDTWVVAPRWYEAYRCFGKCVSPLTKHWSPTPHSMIQTLAYEHDRTRVENSCCVPTELSPISMLYLDENNILTYKYQYEGMVVERCGCL